MPASPVSSNLFLRVLDWWRPAGALTRPQLFQLRCVVAYSLFALAVTLVSWLQSLGTSSIGLVLLGGYAVATIAQLVALRLGVSTALVAWGALLQLGIFLALVALVSTAVRMDQLFWLVLLPLGARAGFPGTTLERDAPWASGGRAMLLGTVMAVVLGIVVLVLQTLGINFGRPPRNVGHVIMGTEHVLFVTTVVGLLWVHERTVRASLEELQLLQRLVTCCAWCRNVREDDGTWVTPDVYLSRRNQAPVSHGICPDCSVTRTG